MPGEMRNMTVVPQEAETKLFLLNFPMSLTSCTVASACVTSGVSLGEGAGLQVFGTAAEARVRLTVGR